MNHFYFILITSILGILILIDFYLWLALKKTVSPKNFVFLKWIIPFTSILFLVGFGVNVYRSTIDIYNSNKILNLTIGTGVGFVFIKLIVSIFFFVEDIIRFIRYLKNKILPNKKQKTIPSFGRRKFVRNLSLSVASLPLLGTLYAITKGKYNFHLKKINLFFKRIPASFNGLKVIQFCDFHAGSFDDFRKVETGMSLINEENPDIIVFTGDLINNRIKEAAPYFELFKNLDAKYGKFAVLGNHDYGDYIPFKSDEERQNHREQLEQFFLASGFQLLNNENIQINNGSDLIDIIGVENWGSGRFPKYGNIDSASQNLQDDRFNIVLSHDPDHWEYILREHPKHFDLTLSGHTHGFQLGVNIPGWKWSSAQYRYKKWLGLYEENNKKLFVSKGFGFLGFPGRLGMSPEIVSFTLYSDN